jgi:hypothetical protein
VIHKHKIALRRIRLRLEDISKIEFWFNVEAGPPRFPELRDDPSYLICFVGLKPKEYSGILRI